MDALECRQNFKSKGEATLEKYEDDEECFYYQSVAFEAMAQQSIDSLPDETFEYLAKFQHSCSVLNYLRFLTRKLNSSHRFSAILKLIRTISNPELQSALILK